MAAERVGRFMLISDDGRTFHVTAWQEREPQRFGRSRVRMVPTIQNLETDEGYYVRLMSDGRYELPELGITATRVDPVPQNN